MNILTFFVTNRNMENTKYEGTDNIAINMATINCDNLSLIAGVLFIMNLGYVV